MEVACDYLKPLEGAVQNAHVGTTLVALAQQRKTAQERDFILQNEQQTCTPTKI